MSNVASTMATLQFGDSFFPSGSSSFSWGLEALAANGGVTGAETCTPLSSASSMRAGPSSIAWSSGWRIGSTDIVAVSAIDDQVEIQTPCAELRSGSRRMGEAMLSVFARLESAAPAYREMIKRARLMAMSR